MKIRQLPIEGAFEITPQQHGDRRGLFLEWYRYDLLAEAVGHPLELAQANISTSARGVVRGIHFAEAPPGQAKYLTCVQGAVLDVVVDLRRGSPTFGRWEATHLDDVDRRAVYVAEGLGHGFCAVTDDATVAYLCSTTYNPAVEHTLDALDPELGIAWPVDTPVRSERDAAAPPLAEITGRLPDYQACQARYRALGRS